MAAILQIIGFKNSGKTTLLNALIRASRKENYTVSAIKHDAHDFSVDHVERIPTRFKKVVQKLLLSRIRDNML